MWSLKSKNPMVLIDYETGYETTLDVDLSWEDGHVVTSPPVYGLISQVSTLYNVEYTKSDYIFMRDYVEAIDPVGNCDYDRYAGGTYDGNGVCNMGNPCSLLNWLKRFKSLPSDFYMNTSKTGFVHIYLKAGYDTFIAKAMTLCGA